MIEVPTADPAVLAAVVLALLAGATAPTYYAAERLRGFGRAVFAKVPYRPPPGQDASEALIEAADASDGEDSGDRGDGE